MFKTVFVLLSLVLSCSVAFLSTGTARSMVGARSLQMGNLIDNFRFVKHYNRFTFKTLYKCVVAAGLEETLAGPGPFTVFAPTDAAFAELPEGTIEALLADIPKLQSILTYHVLAGKVDQTAVKAATSLVTLNGKSISVAVEGDRAWTDDAKLLVGDKEVDNGIFHVIDQIMIPK